jgi:hypothetical protein
MDEDYTDYDYSDTLSERAKALCMVAKTLDEVSNKSAQGELLTMMKKINLSIQTPSTAELSVIDGERSAERQGEQGEPLVDLGRRL